MATNTVVGNLVCSDGTNIPLKAEIAEDTESDLTTDTAYSIAAQNIGDYAPGKVLVGGSIQADNGISYAYVLSQGLIAAIIPVSVKGISQEMPMLCAPYQLKAGDKVRVLTLDATSRNAAVCAYTAQGVSRIFVATPAGAATQNLLDLQTNNQIGDTLQGQTIVKAFGTSIDGSKIETMGAYVVDSLGNVVGAVPLSDPADNAPLFSMSYNIPVALNFKCQFLTNA
tara:strand:- start:924 stop:1601 length:678 start_codon:yes stop_codon:yes gene_type:complete